jgi:hypothetical protein
MLDKLAKAMISVRGGKPRGTRRDNLKLNYAGKKTSVVCLAIQTVAAV